jgi:pimeloyl-ACP methyl ester carboxylesterase
MGAVVADVVPGQTAASLGVRPGDLIVSAGGRPVRSSGDVVDYAKTLFGGSSVELAVRRGGKALTLRGKAISRPRENYPNATVHYGAVPFRGGHLRDILVEPNGVSRPPLLFLIQGFTCTSIEPPSSEEPYRRLAAEMSRQGVAFYRVEKPGMGDSAGGPNCTNIDYATELDAFRSAYNHLIEVRGFDPDRIFMFGHSLGGLQAPMLAAERPPRGVAAFGTVLRNWADYHRDIDLYQSYLFSGIDPAAEAERSEKNREILRLFYLERLSPAEIAKRNPDAAEPMRELLNWDGGERMFGRHYKFAQDLPHQPVIKAWRDTRSNVLALYGESDVVALFDSDHEMIADIAEFRRPGSGRYVQLEGTDHGMTLVGDRRTLREKTIAEGSPPTGAFNTKVAELLAEWIRSSMAKPPVRTLPERSFPVPATAAG